jgi:hypothetical protein
MTGRTGASARDAAGEAGDPPGMTRRATYRGVRWRQEHGAVGWYNEGKAQWVRWHPGGDSPPVPPRWEAEGLPEPPPRVKRAGWRSPYRLVPIVLVVGIVIIGVVQALKPTSDPVAAERVASAKLVGKCLARKGTVKGHPAYGPSPVSCELPVASVKVAKVLPGTPGAPRCPRDTTAVQLVYPGVRYPHVECVTPVPRS